MPRANMHMKRSSAPPMVTECSYLVNILAFSVGKIKPDPARHWACGSTSSFYPLCVWKCTWVTLGGFPSQARCSHTLGHGSPTPGLRESACPYVSLVRMWVCMCIWIFIAALYTVAETWKQPKCLLLREWMNKPWYYTRVNTNGLQQCVTMNMS